MRWSRLGIVTAVAALVGIAGLGATSGRALAYGAADHPLAQIEISGNCNNPDFDFCAPPPDGVGLGGIWLWIEIDDGGVGDVAGSGCGHTIRGGGPGSAGATSIRGEITWEPVHTADPSAYGEAALPGIVDPNGDYYLVTVPTPFGDDLFLFPMTNGHYGFHPGPGVTIQVQIAP